MPSTGPRSAPLNPDYHRAADRRGDERLLSDLVRAVPYAGPEDTDVDEDDPADFGEPRRAGGGA